jgi:hypothetical protein
MKSHALLSLLILSLASCEKRATLLEEVGTLKSPDGNCEAVLSAGSRGLTIRKVIQRSTFGMATASSEVTPASWTNHPGAFVFFESDDRVWAFDGVEQSFIYVKRDKGSVSYSFDSYPGHFPSEVINRLPESLASKYRARTGKL